MESIPQSAHCPAIAPLVKNAPSWNGWGIDLTNSRFQNPKAAGLTAAEVPKLIKWAFGYPGVTTAFGTPTVFGGRIFVGAQDGTVFSLDAKSGCIYWMYKATEGVRTGPVISSDGKIAYIADLHAWVHAVDAETGTVTLGTVPVSCETDTKNNRQRQRFSLTPTLSTLINEVNGKRWPYVSALPPFLSRTFAKFSEGSAHVRGGGAGRLPAHSLVRH